MPTTKLSKHASKLIFLVIAAFYLLGLGALPLVGPDEPRYAEVAREMFVRRDFITPTLGAHPWFEKPALLYWLMIASYRVLGVNEYAARLAPALCGLVTGAFVFWLGKTVDQSKQTESEKPCHLGEWSALVFLSSLGAMAFSRAASFDIVLTMTLTGALCCFIVWHIYASQGRTAPSLLAAFYVFVGLSLLAKGLVGVVLPFAIITLYFAFRREWPRKQLFASFLWGVPLALIVAASWYGPMLYRHGWTFIDQFIIQHHFARFLSNKYHHPQPIYFYVPIVLLMVLPWTVVLIAGLASSRRWSWREDDATNRLRVFALVWIVVPIVFFSLSKSKIPGYVLPVLPAAAILIGERITCFLKAHRGQRATRVTGALLLIGAAVGVWYSVREAIAPNWLIGTAAAVVCLVALFAIIAGRVRAAFVLFAAIPFVIGLCAFKPAKAVASRDSVRDLMQAADAKGYSSTPVFYLLCDDRSAEFYASGRLAYDPTGEPTRFDGAQDVAAAIHQKGGTGLVLIETRWEKQLTDYRAVQAEKIGENGWISIFAVSAL
ncbi:MAG TPA: glycosyltransferase family 39 protein [Pyrinomonadaceae bacterium]|nr:glycosyltransferase family 39 protein [Pyrinomonadaceae bacterium]